MAEMTPMMKQYLELKEQYKDALLFFRLGDFYEMFFEDAIIASKELEITLTGRECGQEERAPMCGVPFHAAEGYIARLIEKGYKVAIGEQLENPVLAKGIVKRDVVRVITPGTVVETNMLLEKQNNYIMSIFKTGLFFGIAVCDISTGDFYASEIKEENNFSKLLDEIARYSPVEIIVNNIMYETKIEIEKIKERFNSYISMFNMELQEELSDSASTGLMDYLKETQKIALEHINKVQKYNITSYMSLDINARRNLELTEKMRDKSKVGTLLWVLDKTSTSMGGRLLRRWINDPLINTEQINLRLHGVEELKTNEMLRGDIREALKKVYDIERLIGKISYGNANARDLIALKNSLKKLPDIKDILKGSKSNLILRLYNELDTLEDIHNLIETWIVEDPPITIKEGGVINFGINEELDILKRAKTEGKNWIVELESKEKEQTGIKNLKVGYNKVFGYYIEVTKSYLSRSAR